MRFSTLKAWFFFFFFFFFTKSNKETGVERDDARILIRDSDTDSRAENSMTETVEYEISGACHAIERPNASVIGESAI